MTASFSPKPVEILFVGNSFTHGHTAPAQFYNAAAISDLNGTGYGGVPGIFKRLTDEAGLGFNVTIEAGCGMTLSGHHENKSGLIASPRWDVVVLQELSMRPLPSHRGGDPGLYLTGAEKLSELLRPANPAVQIYLYETWASPASVSSGGYGDPGGLRRMQEDLRASIVAVCDQLGLAGVVRVGEAFLQAVEQGVAISNPCQPGWGGNVNLWAEDNRHAGVHGSYLAAGVFYAHLAGAAPGKASPGAGCVARELGLEASVAAELDRIACEAAGL